MLITLLLLSLVGEAILAPTGDVILHEKRSLSIPGERRRVPRDAILPIRIALTQRNLDKGYEYLMEVSDPRSQKYGKHWTTEEIHDEFAPSDETSNAVISWLGSHGYNSEDLASSTSRGWLALAMFAHDAERLFSAEYYEHRDHDGNTVIACDEYYLPSHISEHVDYVLPGVMSSRPVKKRKVKRDLDPEIAAMYTSTKIPPVGSTSYCGTAITPACWKALYQIPDATLNQPQNALGVFETGGAYDQLDLDLYWKYIAPWVPNGTHPKLESINGATAPVATKKGQDESVVDFAIAYSLVYPQDIVLYETAVSKAEEKVFIQEYGPSVGLDTPFLALLDALDGKFCTEAVKKSGADCGTAELTTVLSASYGGSELQSSEPAAKRICAEFMKFGLKGHTIVFASGDYGMGQQPPIQSDPSAPLTNGCIDPKDISSVDVNGTVFNPTFPASCPFVTAAGATQLNFQETVDDAESAMHYYELEHHPKVYSFSSTGGVSNYFSMPAYQKSAVDEYFSKHNPGYPTYKYEGLSSVGANGGLYSSSGRSIPDVAANGAHMAIFVNGGYTATEGGTSLAAPIISSIITLINQQRTLAGKGSVGFINPVLYQNPDAFNDITRGSNPGCGTEGFHAVEGWDPITGLGTPNYPKLLEVFMALP